MNAYLILSIIVAVEAIAGNTILIIAIFTGCPSLTTSNRKTLFISSILRICYTISFAITSPALYYIEDQEAAIIVSGVVWDHKIIGTILLILKTIFILICMIVPPLQFVQRYFHIVLFNSDSKRGKCCAMVLAALPILGTLFCIITFFSFIPSEVEEQRFYNIAYYSNTVGDTAYFLISLKDYTNTYDPVSSFPDSPWNIAAFVSTVILVSSIVVVMIYCWLQIRHVFCDNWNNLSAKTIKMMRQLQFTFLVQFLTSIVFFVFPFSLLLVGPVLKVNPGRVLIEIGTHLYRMFPAFSGWIIIIFVKEIRQSAWSFVSRSSKTGSSVDDSSQNNSKQRIVGHNS